MVPVHQAFCHMGSDETGSACYQNLHGIASQEGWDSSFLEMELTGSGHSIPNAGSFHLTPSSLAGL